MLLRVIRVWAGCFLASVAAIGMLEELPKALLLARDHTTTRGIVVRVDHENHGATTVRYSVNSLVHEQTVGPEGVEVGEAVVVYYRPNYPEQILLSEPSAAVREELFFGVTAGFLFAAVLSAFWLEPRYFWSQRRHSNPKE